jgi:hypothetical protein
MDNTAGDQIKMSYDTSNGVKMGSDSVGNGVIEPLGTMIFTSYESIAAAGSNQGTAANLTKFYSTVTGSDGAKGVELPTGAIVGTTCHVVVAGASALKVYPPSGQQINAGSANAAATMAGGGYVMFVYAGSNIWSAFGPVT